MSKFTLAPWRVSIEQKTPCVYGSPNGNWAIIQPLVATCDNADLSDAENEANARLVAAAPDLLEAAEAVIGELDPEDKKTQALYRAICMAKNVRP